MKTIIAKHPSETIVEFLIKGVTLTERATSYLEEIIQTKRQLIFADFATLASLFKETSPQFWEALQDNWNMVEDRPCPDMSELKSTMLEGLNFLFETGQPFKITAPNFSEPVVCLSERSYKHMLSNCVESDLHDLGWVGSSEKFVQKKGMSPKLQTLLQQEKEKEKEYTPISLEVKQAIEIFLTKPSVQSLKDQALKSLKFIEENPTLLTKEYVKALEPTHQYKTSSNLQFSVIGDSLVFLLGGDANGFVILDPQYLELIAKPLYS